MRNKLLLVVFLFVTGIANSQFYKKHENDKFKFFGVIDLRNTSIEGNNVEYYGLKLGVGNNRLRLGLSYHIFHKNLFSVFTENDFSMSPRIGNYQVNYQIGSIFTELILYQTSRWELVAPINLGIGLMNLNSESLDLGYLHANKYELDYDKKEEWVESLFVSIKANYRIVKWVGLTGGVGYCQSFSNDDYVKESFSGLFYSFGAKLFFSEFGQLFKSNEYRHKYLWEPNFVKKHEQTEN